MNQQSAISCQLSAGGEGQEPSAGRRTAPVWILLVGAVMAAALIPLAGCRQATNIEATEKIPVRVMRVEQQTMKQSLDYAGNIRAREEARVYPNVSGNIMKKVLDEGARVKKGDIIAYIDRDEVGFTFKKAPVESPLTGYIGRMYVNLGTSVTPLTPIAMVIEIDAVELILNVPEKFIVQVKLGQTAEFTVDAWPQETFIGKVTKISPVIDLDTRTAPVEITIPNPGHRLKPGMFARVKLVLKERNKVPVVMKEAVLGKDPDTYVYVISDGIAHLRNVRLGIREGADYEVTKGLKPEERVVIMGQQRLHDGVSVIAEED